MRPGPTSPRRVLEQQAREDRYHERTARFVICEFYVGPLQDGVESPGYIESINGDRRPAGYVVPRTVLRNRNIVGQVQNAPGTIPADGRAAAARWAGENVRLIQFNHNGMSRQQVMKEFVVKVDFPFYKARSGVLVPKPGQAASWAAVPDGDTADQIARKNMINNEVSIIKKMQGARSRYGTPQNPTIGVPFSPSQEQFPREGECWL